MTYQAQHSPLAVTRSLGVPWDYAQIHAMAAHHPRSDWRHDCSSWDRSIAGVVGANQADAELRWRELHRHRAKVAKVPGRKAQYVALTARNSILATRCFSVPEILIQDMSTRPSRVFGTWVLMLYPCRGTARTKSRCAIHLQGSWKMYMRRCWESGW